MPYRYEAFNREGRQVRGTVEVDSEEALESLLWENGLTIIDVKKMGKPFAWHEQVPSLFGVRGKDVTAFASQLAFLIKAGINIYTALQIIRDQTTRPALRAVLSEVVDDINRGATLSEACAKHPTAFPFLFVRMLKVGEETGRVDDALERVGGYMERRQAAVQKVMSSLTYPAFVLGVAAIAMYIMMVVALPSLAGLFREFHANLPLPTRLMIAAANFAGVWGGKIVVATGFLVVLLILVHRTRHGKRAFDYFLVRMPIFGSLVMKLNMARIADTMGSLIAGGISITEALDLLIETTSNVAVREPLQEVRTDVLSGSSLSQATGRHSIFPPMMVNLLNVSEQAGTLEETLTTLGTMYNDEANRTIATLIGLLEPTLTIGIGLAIGFVAVTIISTIYSVLPQIH